MPGITWDDDPYSTAKEADAVVLITEWNAFRGLDLPRLKKSMKTPVFVDMRNVYSHAEMDGVQYWPVGKVAVR